MSDIRRVSLSDSTYVAEGAFCGVEAVEDARPFWDLGAVFEEALAGMTRYGDAKYDGRCSEEREEGEIEFKYA